MRWDQEEQRIPARFAEWRSAERAAVPGFDQICRGHAKGRTWRMLGLAAGLLIAIGACWAGFVLHGQRQDRTLVDWPEMELVVPEETPVDASPTAPLLTYVDDAPGFSTGDRGFN